MKQVGQQVLRLRCTCIISPNPFDVARSLEIYAIALSRCRCSGALLWPRPCSRSCEPSSSPAKPPAKCESQCSMSSCQRKGSRSKFDFMTSDQGYQKPENSARTVLVLYGVLMPRLCGRILQQGCTYHGTNRSLSVHQRPRGRFSREGRTREVRSLHSS
jgi:hypothetical protein